MTTYKRVCVRDHMVRADNGDTLTLVAGKEYITSAATFGWLTVYSSFWVKVRADLFEGAEPFTTDPPDPHAACLAARAQDAERITLWRNLADKHASRLHALEREQEALHRLLGAHPGYHEPGCQSPYGGRCECDMQAWSDAVRDALTPPAQPSERESESA